MYGIGRCGDRHDRSRLSYVGRSGQHRRATKAVPDELCRGVVRSPQMVGSRDEIGDVGREPGVRELALACTYPCEIETQDSNAAGGKRLRDPASREIVLAAGAQWANNA